MQAIEQRSVDASRYREQVCGVVKERWDRARMDYQLFYSKVPRWYDAYRGIYSGRFHPFRNNVNLPLLFATAQSDVATKVQMTFGQWPIVQMFGYGSEDAAIARKNEVLISAQMKDCHSFEKATDFYLSSVLYGTAILQYGWREDIRKNQKLRVPASMISGDPNMTGEQIVYRDVTRFCGPDWNVVDILDFGPAPSSKTIEGMEFCVVRSWMDLDQITALGKIGYFDKEQVEALKARGPAPNTVDEWKERRNSLRSPMAEDSIRQQQRYLKPVQLYEMWGTLPDELVPPDGGKHRVITIAENSIVLRNEPNPFWSGEKPFLSYSPQADPHYFFGPGKIELSEKMQYTANRLANQKLDVLDLIVDPVVFYDQSRYTNKQELYIRSGKNIGVDGPPGEVVLPWSPDIRGVQLAYQEIDQLWQWVEQGTGVIRDTVQGGNVTKRQTAREFTGRQERAMTRLALEARLAEESWIEPLANAFRQMNRQYLPVPKELRILGVNGILNPITGGPMPQEPLAITLEDMYPDYDVRATGASQALSEQAIQQNLILAIQTLTTTPLSMAMNWPAIGKQLFQALKLRNVDELLITQDPQLVLALAQLLQQMNTAAPEGGGEGDQGLADGGMNDGTMMNEHQPAQTGY